MDDTNVKFKTEEDLKEWLGARGVEDADDLKKATTLLMSKGCKESDSLLGLTRELLQQMGFDVFLANSLSNKFKPHPPQHVSDLNVAALNDFAEEFAKKKRTIVLSNATQGIKNELIEDLGVREEGSSWPNKPDIPLRIQGFVWPDGVEDSTKNRQAYMTYLKQMLQIPEGYDLADMQPERTLLNVELFRGSLQSRKVKGTTDVAIARTQNVYNKTVRHNILTLLELKTPSNMKSKDHCPQTIMELITASYLNPNHAIVAVLTDLCQNWIFFWYAPSQEDEEGAMSLYKLSLHGDDAATEAKFLLDSLFSSNEDGEILPTAFAERQPFRVVLQEIQSRKKQRIDLDDDTGRGGRGGDNNTNDGGGKYPGSRFEDSSSGKMGSSYRGQTNTSVKGGAEGGSDSMNLAEAMSLFAPAADRDIANELDLVDMLEDPEEQYEVVSRFVAKNILPYVTG